MPAKTSTSYYKREVERAEINGDVTGRRVVQTYTARGSRAQREARNANEARDRFGRGLSVHTLIQSPPAIPDSSERGEGSVQPPTQAT